MNSDTLYITSPSMPDLDEYISMLKQIWQSRHLTNMGPYHERLELELSSFLGAANVSLVTNGTLGLMLALQALKVKRKVITTPFTFAATANVIIQLGLEPVFCDIDPVTLTLDPSLVEAAITDDVGAIMPVHVYGNPGDLLGFQQLGESYNIPIVYDAAHSFGVKSHLGFGDATVYSFHATKAFNTVEGGLIVTRDATHKRQVDLLRNFGFTSEEAIDLPGFNAKMNEFQAAFGLLQLKRWSYVLEARKNVYQMYHEMLAGQPAVHLLIQSDVNSNYSYVPVRMHGASRDKAYIGMREAGIIVRKYFYPLVSSFKPFIQYGHASDYPVASKAAAEMLCLPISEYMTEGDVERVVGSLVRHASA